ncbi:MAG: ATP-grasp domain-containing protein [Anaerovoracaceae bacterium]|jgi:biotin carboxylase
MSAQNNEKKPVAVVLGGTVPHIELLKKLKRRGYFTVLIDYYKNPPARDYADEHVCESTLDRDIVLRTAAERQAAIVLGPCVDQANVVACYVSEQLGLPEPYDLETAKNVTDKGRMKTIMTDHGIPTSPFAIVGSSAEAAQLDPVYPAVVKPVDNNGSKGVRRVDSREELLPAVEQALSLSRAGRAVVEQFNDGFEIQVDCMVSGHVTDVIMKRRRLKTKPAKGMAIQPFGSVIPAVLGEELDAEIDRIAGGIADAFGLNDTPFFIQAIVRGSSVSVLEFAPRIGGTLSYFLMKEITGFDALDAAVAGIEGSPIDVRFHAPEHYYTTSIIYAQPGILGKITGLEEMKAAGRIIDFHYMKTPGMEFGTVMDSRNRAASYIIRADSRKELLEKAGAVNREVDVLNEKGESIMCRDLVLTDAMIPGGIR